MKKDHIFIFFGGNMSGIFGAGVVTALQELNVYNRIHSIYAISSGAHNAAYFLARDTKIGSTIYYENLIETNFIKNCRFNFVYKLVLNLFIKNIELEKLVDIDYLIKIEKTKKKLNTKKISNTDIDFFIRCFNTESKKEEYLDGRKDILKKLRATAAIVPFYPKLVKIGNKKYSDGDTLSKYIDPLLENMINENKDKKIYFVFNNSQKNRNSMKFYIENFYWAILLFLFFKKRFVINKLNIISEEKKLKKYFQKFNVQIIEPDFDFSVFCTDKQKLLKLYKNGIDKTKKIMNK